MKYLIFILGLVIITLRALGVEIDISSIGLFVFISIIIISISDISQLSELSAFGVKIKLNKELKKLNDDTYKLRTVNKKIPPIADLLTNKQSFNKNEVRFRVPDNNNNNNNNIKFGNSIEDVIKLSNDIENKLNLLYGNVFLDDSNLKIPPYRIVDKFVAEKYFENDFVLTFRRFWKIRNIIIHNMETNISKPEIISFMKSGERILSFINNKIQNLTEKK
ncbi:hypothetical protein L3049_18495 [Labilibaculum sp. DW002]|uniref:DUF4145 domain-containing protein n=1 Tax=Paralabilibaculum antarcticum TaxID=2912572 RepID=A0ABT5VZH4_9BACT|nr:hypothetical protein [Labilibaculum sp. DW002]MDE5419983.1 hypothetical protein [Labilibaculum sp. DW002]